MITTPVPIHHGSPRFHEAEVGPFRITDVEFGPQSRIEPHHHDRPNIGVMLGGSFNLAFASRGFDCEPGVLFVEPAGETHCNCMGCRGARVIAVQPAPEAIEVGGTLAAVLERPSASRGPHAVHLARRIARECQSGDEFSTLMIEGLALELLAVAGRAGAHDAPAGAPAWLRRVEEQLSDAGSPPVRLADLARDAGVHAAHVAREFRLRHGRSIGGFLLEKRLEWAARELSRNERPLVEIALEAGFADQSHFTRRFREYAGVTPGRFRASARA
jgi:AraC family transcriptional regulator